MFSLPDSKVTSFITLGAKVWVCGGNLFGNEFPGAICWRMALAGAKSQLKRYDGGFHNLLAEPKLKDQAGLAWH